MTFILNIQTLSMETNAAIVSAALVYFDETITSYDGMSEHNIYDMLERNSMSVTFNVKEQHKYRAIDPETVAWWKKIPLEERSMNFRSEVAPVFVSVGKLRTFIDKYIDQGKPKMCFTRNAFHHMCMNSLCKDISVMPPFKFSEYYDMRTAELLMLDTAWTETTTLKFNKYDPVDNCILDAMKLMLG